MKDLNKFFQENENLIHFATQKALGRLLRSGLGDRVEYEEIYGELTEVFVRSFNQYDPERSKFSTYFVMASTNHITSKIEKMYRLEIKLDSIDATVGDEDSSALVDLMASSDTSFEDELELQSELKFMRESLSPLAVRLLDYSINPPEFIVNEFKAQRAQVALASSLGLKTSHSTEITIQFVANCLRDTTDSPETLKFIKSAVDEVKGAVLNLQRAN